MPEASYENSGNARWHVEIFDVPELVGSFLNHLDVRPDQLVGLQFYALSPTAQRIMLTCRLTQAQYELRTQWQAVENIVNPPTLAVATGGGH